MTLIKAVHTKRYEVELIQMNNYYVIVHSSLPTHEPVFSENITDFKTATFLFDIKINELEGH